MYVCDEPTLVYGRCGLRLPTRSIGKEYFQWLLAVTRVVPAQPASVNGLRDAVLCTHNDITYSLRPHPQETVHTKLSRSGSGQEAVHTKLSRSGSGQETVHTKLSRSGSGQETVHTKLSRSGSGQDTVHTKLSRSGSGQDTVHTKLSRSALEPRIIIAGG